MKKFITLLTSITFVGSITTNVIGCKKQHAQIQLIMDGKGAVDDNSFNQLVWEGIKRFGKDNKKTVENFNPKDIGWDTDAAKRAQYKEYRTAYRTAFENGTEVVVANGYYHSASVTDFALKNRKKPFVLVDATLDKSRDSETKDLTNVAPLIFKSEQASFVSGIIACAYLNKYQDKFLTDDKKNLNLTSFGGGNFASVVNYMTGLRAASFWWNKHKSDDEGKKVMQLMYPDFDISNPILPVNDITAKDDKAFSGTFIKDGNGKKQAQKLISDGADIIMPVAGIQTEEVLDVIGTELQNRTVNVIGVDGDQRKLYNNSNIIISALKNLDKATYDALDVWYNKKNTEEKKNWFHGNEPIVKGLTSENAESEDWVGVVSDEISTDKVSDLIKQLTPDIQKVTAWWSNFYEKEDLWTFIAQKMNDQIFD